MSEQKTVSTCLACGRGEDETPLILLAYRGDALWICPQHLPVLIHDPARLVGTLPGAENLRPAEHHD
ncbi:MAG: hypothetical protein U0736_10730 [Gemmataceae bacterium]